MKLANPKLLNLDDAIKKRKDYRDNNTPIVLTNGCFDLIHPGHLYYLQEASKIGKLWLALNSDSSIKTLKGPSRPVQNLEQRAYCLAALECVDTIISFNTPRLDAEILALNPENYTKAGDYTLETLNLKEREALNKVEAKIHFLPFLQGYSTTKLIQKITTAANTF